MLRNILPRSSDIIADLAPQPKGKAKAKAKGHPKQKSAKGNTQKPKGKAKGKAKAKAAALSPLDPEEEAIMMRMIDEAVLPPAVGHEDVALPPDVEDEPKKQKKKQTFEDSKYVPGEFNEAQWKFVREKRKEGMSYDDARALWMMSDVRSDLMGGLRCGEMKKRRFL